MATRSLIAQRNADQTITAIYCHWDGAPDWNGRILVQHYTDPIKIGALLALGSLSSLDAELGDAHAWSTTHPGWCHAHGRDGGPSPMPAWRVATDADVIDLANDLDAEYVYRFADGVWLVWSAQDGAWSPVADVLATAMDLAA